jgi:hypothetical protein
MNIPARHDPSESLVWDGGFETDVAGGGFSWHIDPPRGSVVRFSKNIKHSGARALEIKFDGKHNVDFRGVCQLIVVNPETIYDFSAWLRTDGVSTDKGVFFRLDTPQNHEPEAVTPELTGTHDWTRFSLTWTAQKNAHLLQVCVARTPSQKLYNTIAGTVWVDDIELLPR